MTCRVGNEVIYKQYYSPYLNRMTQPDTIVPDPGNPKSWNRYSYTKNNPINFIDISGHDDGPWWSTGAVLGGAKGTTVGILGSIADGPIPVIDLGGGLGGLIEGAKMGHNIHKKTTDRIEASLSFASSLATYGSTKCVAPTLTGLIRAGSRFRIADSPTGKVRRTLSGQGRPPAPRRDHGGACRHERREPRCARHLGAF